MSSSSKSQGLAQQSCAVVLKSMSANILLVQTEKKLQQQLQEAKQQILDSRRELELLRSNSAVKESQLSAQLQAMKNELAGMQQRHTAQQEEAGQLQQVSSASCVHIAGSRLLRVLRACTSAAKSSWNKCGAPAVRRNACVSKVLCYPLCPANLTVWLPCRRCASSFKQLRKQQR